MAATHRGAEQHIKHLVFGIERFSIDPPDLQCVYLKHSGSLYKTSQDRKTRADQNRLQLRVVYCYLMLTQQVHTKCCFADRFQQSGLATALTPPLVFVNSLRMVQIPRDMCFKPGRRQIRWDSVDEYTLANPSSVSCTSTIATSLCGGENMRSRISTWGGVGIESTAGVPRAIMADALAVQPPISRAIFRNGAGR
ncbi:hypothetical protein RRG08_049577 [Elysia crispata]|uniref:Uncharacterized protein n=1 Tax=Elysia crispata TaxID=231223 RepID=A0AAE1E4X9_9GAST|nr:hypothetical protein RRG08_049577 [Elysia crispata]